MALSIYYQNIRGMKSKTTDISTAILNNEYDIICLCETWLDDSIFSAEFFDSRYTVYRRDRSSSFKLRFGKHHGGGVLIAISNTLLSEHRADLQTSVEDLWLRIKLKNTYLHLCVVYLPSYLPIELFFEFINRCEDVVLHSKSSSSTLILGDFNLPSIIWSKSSDPTVTIPDNKSTYLTDFIARSNLLQLNYLPNKNNKTLDLALTDSTCLCILSSTTPISRIDDHHPPFEVLLNTGPQHSLRENSELPKYLFRKTDYNMCISELSIIDWGKFSHSDTDELLQQFYNTVWETIDKYTPKGKRNKHRYPAWFSSALIKVLKEKTKFHVKYKKYGNPRDYDSFSLLRSRSKMLMDSCFKSYIANIEDNLSINIKSFWRYTKSRKVTNDIPKQMFYGNLSADNGITIANLFANYFSSVYGPSVSPAYTPTLSPSNYTLYGINICQNDVLLALKSLDVSKGAGPDGLPPIFIRLCSNALAEPLFIIFQKSLTDGVFPSLWKLANIVPIHKAGSKNDVSNYRPISVLSCFAKVFEGLVYKFIYSHFLHLLNPHQHGFVKKRSTTSNLLQYTNYLCSAFNEKKQVDSIYTDFAKAFDRVNHHILVSKLSHLGIHGSLLRWLDSYLLNRTQLVTVYGFDSSPFLATSGVPQGSNLGPLLFLVYINDLLNQLTCDFLAYADDIKIFRKIDSNIDCELLQTNLNIVHGWCINNYMSLNVEKCQYITFTKNKNILEYPYNINGVPLNRVYVVKDLGVLFDSTLSFRAHYDSIVARANRIAGFILRTTKPFQRTKSVVTLYTSLCRSILEYCSSIWSPCYSVHRNRIESVQKRFLRHLCSRHGLRRSLPEYGDRLHRFKLADLESRRRVNDLVTLHKIMNNNMDSDLFRHCFLRVSGRSSRVPHLFSLPPANNMVSINNPLVRMCQLYNSLDSGCDIFYQSSSTFIQSILKQI